MIFRPKKKIFCIGRNKTGTTSIEAAFKAMDLRIGDFAAGEMLMEDWAKRDFRRLIKYCRTATAFRDVPFSLPYTYQAMDAAFPGSKFILTVRDSSEQWYNSVIRYHTKIVGKNRRPTADDLREYGYRFKGFVWRQQQLVYGADETTLYDRDLYIRHYEQYNRDVLEYFRFRPDDLLVLNVSEPTALDRLCKFLEISPKGLQMPHLNRSGD